MADNRFEQVDEAQPDAITLTLTPGGSVVSCPAGLTGGRLTDDFLSEELAPVEAFRSAIGLANEIKAAVVVVDPGGRWQPAWGRLYRDADA